MLCHAVYSHALYSHEIIQQLSHNNQEERSLCDRGMKLVEILYGID